MCATEFEKFVGWGRKLTLLSLKLAYTSYHVRTPQISLQAANLKLTTSSIKHVEKLNIMIANIEIQAHYNTRKKETTMVRNEQCIALKILNEYKFYSNATVVFTCIVIIRF